MALIKYLISNVSAATLTSGRVITSMSNSPPPKIIDPAIKIKT